MPSWLFLDGVALAGAGDGSDFGSGFAFDATLVRDFDGLPLSSPSSSGAASSGSGVLGAAAAALAAASAAARSAELSLTTSRMTSFWTIT